MRSLTKNRNLIIAILLAVVLAIAGVLAFVFTRPINEAYAADNYGEFKADGYYDDGGVVFYAIKVKEVGAPTTENGKTNYYPTYKLAENKLQFIKYGETVLLNEGESILISFARQEDVEDDNKSLEEKLVGNRTNGYLSDYVDFLTVSLKFNEKTPETDTTVGEIQSADGVVKKMFGYVFSPYSENIGAGSKTKEEGLVQFTANYEHGTMMNEFNFSFYVFKKETYQRNEDDSYNGRVRPNTTVDVLTGGGNYVTDPATIDKFYGEYFYYYKNQNLPTLTYNPERYEVNISKTIHSTLTTYTFAYNKTQGEVVYSKNQNPSTEDVYARDIAYKKNADGTITLRFKDIGIYDISYTAIYYKNNARVELRTLNEEFNLQDRLTIFGAQATYNDHSTKQTELRNEDNSVSADITGKGVSFVLNGETNKYVLSGIQKNKIASTNQPQVKFLMNSLISSAISDTTFKVYYSNSPDLTNFSEDDDLTLTSNFTKAGYYYVVVKHAYENLKTWHGSSAITSNNKVQEQQFLFEIKDQTPTINILKMDEEEKYTSNKVMSGYYTKGVYTGSYHNGGIFIEKFAENSEFDLPTTYEIQKRAFGTDNWVVFTPELKSNVEGTGDAKDGYIVGESGHYKLVVRFGNASSTTRYFDVDKEQIGGLNAYKVVPNAGNKVFTIVENSQMNNSKIWAINQSFILNWQNKASGAKISASYVRFAMENSTFATDANDYIIGSMLATDSLIRIADNPETAYSKPQSLQLITANEVLNLAGLYIFKLQDEAGNVAYFAIIYDNSTAVVLQGEENGDLTTYEIIKGFNNISSPTRVFFGKGKLVKLSTIEYDGFASAEYLDQIFGTTASLNNDNRFVSVGETTFARFAITSVEAESVVGAKKVNKPITNLEDGYDIIEIETDENGVIEKAYTYTITYESANKKVHNVQINTDKTGLGVHFGNVDNYLLSSGITSTIKGSEETDDVLSQRTTYFDATNEDILYLTWETLTPNIDAYVDLNQGGIKIHYYEMIYNPQLKTYEYAENPTNTIVITEDMVEDVNGRVCIKINVVDNQTLAGKYEIVRQYVKKEGISSPLNDIVGNDFVIRRTVFYVDRNPIIKAPSGTQDSPQIGAYASIKFFDGVDGEIITFDQLFRQAQNSGNAVIQTNKLPVGIYIPIAKYGYIDENNEFKDNLKLFGSQIDQDSYYAPFELTVILQSPVVDGYYVNYIYSHDKNGYFKLSGWEKIAAGDVNETAVAWGTYDDASASLLKNELEGTTAWSEGVYSLKIGTMRASDRETTLQNFYFNFEVVGDEPEFDLTAQYPTLPNMEDKEILGEDGKYYTNAEQIKVSWNDLQSTYMVKIDKSTIQYSINGGTWQNVDQSNIISNGTQNYFTIDVNDVNNLKIKMSFEVYGKGINASLFPGGNHTAIKEIVFDRQAPTTIINSLMDADIVKHNLVGQNLLRESGLRYNISASEGIYKYFTFATTATGLASKFEELFSLNQVADTNRVYIRMFSEILEGENEPQKDNKYDSKIIEIGCPLNPNSSPSNLFNEQSALTNEDLGWRRYVKDETIQFTPGQYYEIVELDLAGNMTIYSVYICEEGYSLTVEHTKDKDESMATIITNNSGEITIKSRERFAINNVLFNSGAYKYVRLNINGTEYLITPFVDSGKAYNLSTGEEIELNSVVLTIRENVYDVKIYNAVAHANANDKGVHTIKVSVLSKDARLDAKIKREEDKIGVIIYGTKDNAIQFNGDMTIYALNKEENGAEPVEYKLKNGEIVEIKSSTNTYYYIPRKGADWSNYLFLFVWYDNFDTKYSELVLYNQNSEPDYRYVSADPLGVTDLTNEMQSQNNILVSTDIQINISNLYAVKVERRNNDDILFSEIKLSDDSVRVRDGYTSYKLTGYSNPETDTDPAYLGGVVVYRITATANIEGFGDVGASVDIEDKVYTVTIYNQFPAITLRNANGENITQDLFNKKITHSEEVYITYLSGNEISESYGFNSKVYLRLRGSEESYVEIPSGYVVSKPGSYDIRIENYNENGVLAKTWNKEFVIANYDVAFYSVVKYDPTNLENPYQVIVPTGELYKRDNHDYLINYHYILNSDSYEISVNNGVEATLLDTIDEGPYTTKIYQISSVGEGGTSSVKFNRQIAITVIPSTNSILGSSFAYFMGTDSEAVEIKTITTAVKDVYLFEGDLSTSMTLQWNSYYGIPENVIFYQISRDGGTTWSDKIVSSKESLTRINFNKSGNYVIMFTDLAGNTQTISSSAGVRDRYRINFIKSVIFLVNGETPIDNAVYNGEVEINIPTYTLSYYSQTPSIVATLNGEEFYPSKNENGNYSFTKAGTYVVYFNATKGGNKLGISKLTFTIINENDSRWAFNYVNYNNYNIEFIKYNNNLINANNIINGNEILMSVVLGNESFDNGIYTIKMTTNELPKQSFEFSFWLNNAKPDIQVSEQEGVSTTNDITVSLNTINLFEMVGDCTVMINGRELVVLNKEYFEVENFETNISETLTETSPYYIQVYTDNGKLIYSYKVEIVDPLNAITIILIVVGCVVVAVGVLLFFLLRKKLRIK